MHSTLYKQLKVYVDDILEKDGYYKKIYTHNWVINIPLFVLFIFAAILIIILTRSFFDIINNIPLIIQVSKNRMRLTNEGANMRNLINLFSTSFITCIIILAFGFFIIRIYSKKSHSNKININKYAMKNEIISKMKSDHRLKKTLDETFKNTDDKNVVKNILLNDAKINNDKISSQATRNLLYFITSIIAILLTSINDILIKIQLVIIAIVFIIYICILQLSYIDQFRFSDEVLETYIKDYIMNYCLPIHYCRNSK